MACLRARAALVSRSAPFRLNAAVNHLMFAGCRGRVYDRIVVLSGVQPGDSVLDVGSSSGYLTGRLAVAAGPSGRVTGVDPSEPAISYARRRAHPGMTFTVGVAQHLGLPDASFDVVTCVLAVHHVPARQRQAAFAEMYRITRPGGRLLTSSAPPDPRGAGSRDPGGPAPTAGLQGSLGSQGHRGHHRPARPRRHGDRRRRRPRLPSWTPSKAASRSHAPGSRSPTGCPAP